MATNSLAKLKEENKKIRASITKKNQEQKREMGAIMTEFSGQLGSKVGAVAAAAVDAKWADNPGDMAHFGESSIPVVPVVGALTALASLGLVYAEMPATAAAVGRFGTFGLDLGIYHGARDKFAEMYNG